LPAYRLTSLSRPQLGILPRAAAAWMSTGHSRSPRLAPVAPPARLPASRSPARESTGLSRNLRLARI